MSDIRLAQGNGNTVSLSTTDVEQLESTLHGSLIRPDAEGYDEARTIWNAMIDRRPALIAMCKDAADVQTAVRFARKHNLLTAIHGVGHNIAGHAICDGGFVIHLSQMRSVKVDNGTRRAHVEPGVTLGDFDQATTKHGLVTPMGINSTTGVAGLTLGGGFGWLSRKHGMTVDNLVAADVVTADGEFLTVSENDHSDLFWAIRGGGGNFGVVTRFEFELHPMEPERLAGLMVFPLSEASSILKQYREYAAGLGDDTSVWVVLREAPPLPFLPEDVHGTKVLVLAAFHAGDPEEGMKILEPLRSFGTVLGEHVGVMPFTAWQSGFDPLLTPGARNYWKSHNFVELNDETIDIAHRYATELPSSQSEIFFAQLGGAVNRVAPDATAYAHRDANYVLNVHGRWDEAAEDEKGVTWAREFYRETRPHATGGVYINFMTEDEADRVGSGYGPGYERLLAAKRKYDPNNLFRMNQNIDPKQ
jgi:FAD/FMN-containing dehydrogenase